MVLIILSAHCVRRWKSNLTCLMIRLVMSAVECTVVDRMLPSSVATYTACVTTVNTAGSVSILLQELRTTAAISKRMEIAHVLSTSSRSIPTLLQFAQPYERLILLPCQVFHKIIQLSLSFRTPAQLYKSTFFAHGCLISSPL